ncbi:hypothetical protein KR059_002979, partial [Drosophila kikkawai]
AVPLFGTMPNGVSLPNHPNFLNQLAAAISTVATTTAGGGGGGVGGAITMGATSPPKQASNNKAVKPQQQPQGSAPMDLENENEHTADVTSTTNHKDPKLQAASTGLSLPDSAQLYLNGLMQTPPGYLYFPTIQAGSGPAGGNTSATGGASASSVTATGSNTNAQMLMDPTAMMAAAMQQMQQMHYAAAAAAGMPSEAGAVEAALSAGKTTFWDISMLQLTECLLSPSDGTGAAGLKEVIKTKNCILFPPNPNAPPPTIRDRPPGCRTVFVGGLPENITEEVIREIFESCGEITTLRMSKKNFCHIRYRQETAIDRAIYLSGYRLRISALNEPPNFGRLHVDYAQARDDQYDYECRQRQQQREQRHRERMSLDRMRSQSPPPIPHYTDHEATAVAEHLRTNETFVKAIQTITAWLERGDCTKRNANIFYSMIQSTHAHVRRLHADKLQLEEDLKKARDSYRKQMGTMSTQFTQIEKVFNAASHKKVWDHFTKAQRKNIDQWKKLATELRTVQITDDEMEISDDERDYERRGPGAKRMRYDSDSLKDENDSLRCQLEAIRHEMTLERSDYVQREKQIKVLQETIRNMQTQLLQTKMREQKDTKIIEQLERNLKDAGVKQLLLKTKIKETADKLKNREAKNSNGAASNSSNASNLDYDSDDSCSEETPEPCRQSEPEIIDIDKVDDDVRIIEHQSGVVEIHEIEDDENLEATKATSVETKEKESITQNNSKVNNVEAIAEETPISHREKASFQALALSEAKIIALASAYLVLHPHGVDIANIARYLGGMLCHNNAAPSNLDDLANILRKYTNLFKAKDEAKWRFCGFSESTE